MMAFRDSQLKGLADPAHLSRNYLNRLTFFYRLFCRAIVECQFFSFSTLANMSRPTNRLETSSLKCISNWYKSVCGTRFCFSLNVKQCMNHDLELDQTGVHSSPGAALERVPRVPVNPWISRTSPGKHVDFQSLGQGTL